VADRGDCALPYGLPRLHALEGRAENAAGMSVFKTCGLGSSPRQLSRISRSSFGTPYTSLCMLASVMCGRGRERERERRVEAHLRSMSCAAKTLMVAPNSFSIAT
jgi:hypothetical protein